MGLKTLQGTIEAIKETIIQPLFNSCYTRIVTGNEDGH